MDLGDIDRLEQAEELLKGLRDIMVFADTVRQDTVMPVTVLHPFMAVLDKACSLLEEIRKNEKER